MKLRRIYGYDRHTQPVELNVEELINESCEFVTFDADNPEEYIDALEKRIDMLTHLVAYLLERKDLTTKELIKLTGNEFRFEADE